MSIEDIPGSLKDVDRLCEKAGFDDRAKYGLLRTTACQHGEIAKLLSFRGRKDYSEMTQALRDFWSNRVALPGKQSRTGLIRPLPTRLMLRPDARSKNIEY